MGYQYDEDALHNIKQQLNSASSRMDKAVQNSVRAPDAGQSSEVVGDGIADLIRMGTAMSHILDDVADKVHAANGAYDDIENTAKNKMRVARQYGRGPGHGLPLDHVDPDDVNPYTAGDDAPAYEKNTGSQSPYDSYDLHGSPAHRGEGH